MEHPTESMFEAFVIGAVGADETTSFLAHVSACDTCTQKLQSEAQAELAILEVHAASKASTPKAATTKAATTKASTPKAATTRASVLRVPRRRSLLGPGAGMLSLAAALLIFALGRPKPRIDAPSKVMVATAPHAAAQPIPFVVCPDSLEQEKCVDDAHRHGLFVSYPPWASGPPLGGGRPGSGPSGSPFSGQQM